MTPPLYGLNWILTNAQLQLLSFDVPITVYPPTKKEKKKRAKGELPEFKKPSDADVINAAQRWKEKYEGKDPSIRINDLI